jgi:hypothetical protein
MRVFENLFSLISIQISHFCIFDVLMQFFKDFSQVPQDLREVWAIDRVNGGRKNGVLVAVELKVLE